MTGEQRLEQVQAALARFRAEHPYSREQVVQFAEGWLTDARRVTAWDLGPVFAGGGRLDFDNLAAAVRAYTVASDGFREWVLGNVDQAALLPERKHAAQLRKLERTVREAETAIVRERLEAQREAVESELARLESDGAA